MPLFILDIMRMMRFNFTKLNLKFPFDKVFVSMWLFACCFDQNTSIGQTPLVKRPRHSLKCNVITREHVPDGNPETLQALACAHDMWRAKRNYFMHSKLDWVPKYQESEVGIKRYANKELGIGGIIKGTWSDFVVHEVRQRDGMVVELSANSDSYQLNTNSSRRRPIVRFVLCKMGVDTISAIRSIAEFCRVPLRTVMWDPISFQNFEISIITRSCTVPIRRYQRQVRGDLPRGESN